MFKAFIYRIDSVETDDGTLFDVRIEFRFLNHTTPSTNLLTFTATWGSDWRLMAKAAIQNWATTALGETVDGVVFPDLTTV